MRNYTLYVKFNALIVGTIFVCGLLAASLFLYSTSTYMNYELDTSGRELAASISQVISNDILVDDRFAMTEQLLHAQQTNDQVRYILVTYPDGRILASTFTDGLPKGLPERRDVQHDGADKTVTFDSTEGYIREVVYPIDGGLVGYFRIGLSERPAHVEALRPDHAGHPGHLSGSFRTGYALCPGFFAACPDPGPGHPPNRPREL